MIGINTAGASPSGPDARGSIGLGFAIPIDQAKRIADDIIASGTVNRAVLGVTVPSGQAAEIRGAVVAGVVADGSTQRTVQVTLGTQTLQAAG